MRGQNGGAEYRRHLVFWPGNPTLQQTWALGDALQAGLTEWLSDSRFLLAGTCSYLLLPFWHKFDRLRAAHSAWDDCESWDHDANLVGLYYIMHSTEDFERHRHDHYQWLVEQGPGAKDANGRTAEEYFAANWPATESDGEGALWPETESEGEAYECYNSDI